MNPGSAIADHWVLLVTLVAFIGGAWSVARQAIVAAREANKDLERKLHSAMTLWINNGGGDRVREIVTLAVAQEMARHQTVCPVRAQVDEVYSRLRDMEK